MARLMIYIDGHCPLCVAGARRFQRQDALNALKFVNQHDSPWRERLADRFPAETRAAAMTVEMPDGSWRVGWFAWAAILQRLPRWRALGHLMTWTVCYAVGPALYRWVAARRHRISQLLRLPPPCDEHGVCRLSESKP